MQFDECRRSDFNKIPNYQSWPQGLKLRTGSCRHNQINTRHMYAQFFYINKCYIEHILTVMKASPEIQLDYNSNKYT